MNNNLIELTEANFETEVLPTATAVVADFYAPWCGPCKALAPLLEQFAHGFAGRLKFAKVNVDEAPGLAARFKITGVPTLLLFRSGKLVDQIVGFPEPRKLNAWLNKAANPAVTDWA